MTIFKLVAMCAELVEQNKRLKADNIELKRRVEHLERGIFLISMDDKEEDKE